MSSDRKEAHLFSCEIWSRVVYLVHKNISVQEKAIFFMGDGPSSYKVAAFQNISTQTFSQPKSLAEGQIVVRCQKAKKSSQKVSFSHLCTLCRAKVRICKSQALARCSVFWIQRQLNFGTWIIENAFGNADILVQRWQRQSMSTMFKNEVAKDRMDYIAENRYTNGSLSNHLSHEGFTCSYWTDEWKLTKLVKVREGIEYIMATI